MNEKKPDAKKKPTAKKKPAAKKKTHGTFKVKGSADLVTIERHFRTGREYVLEYSDAAQFVESGDLVEVK